MSNFPDARLARAVRRAPWFVFPDQPERGTTYWDWSLTPVKDSGGGVHGLVFSLRETTRYKQAELGLRESEERFRTVPDNAQDSIARFDRLGRFLFTNAFAARHPRHRRQSNRPARSSSKSC